jgi:serine/threonine-protein kinase
MSLFSELKRRNVIRVTIAYVITAWLVLQVADVVLGNIAAPAWVFQVILLVLALGLPIAVLFAWAYELTPHGIRREKDIVRSESVTQQTGRKLDRAIIVILVVAVAYFAFDKFVANEQLENVPTISASAVDTGDKASIAVLPFVNMSSDAEQDYFSDGISEELLNLLAKIPQFQVAGRTSSFAFKGKDDDLRTIGESLGVTTILEGSVRKGGERVRITAQLINVEDGFHLWSETYDRELTDIFAVQDEIASAVVDELKVTLLGNAFAKAEQSDAINTNAYNAYLQGLFYLNKSGPSNRRIAMSHFEEAVAIEPEFASAWAGLSRASVQYSSQASKDVEAALLRGREAADKALELDPGLPEAHIALGFIQYIYDWDWDAAEASYRRALGLRPGDVLARRNLARLVGDRGDIDKSLQMLRSIIEVDPLDENLQMAYAGRLFDQEEFEAGRSVVNRLLEQNPSLSFGPVFLAWFIMYEGRLEEALEHAKAEPVDFARWGTLAILHHRLGNEEASQEAQQQLLDVYGNLAAYQNAQIHAFRGEIDEAVRWLEMAYESRDPGLTSVKTDLAFIPLREHPGFIAL